MYRIFADNQILHNPVLADEGKIVIDPILTERLNTHGSLRFAIAPTNPLYDLLEPRNTQISVYAGTNSNERPWFGRVMTIEKGWNNVKVVYCEGILGCLNDSVYAPFGFKGSPSALLSALIDKYNDSQTNGPVFALGNVSVTDPNNLIVRSSKLPATVWETMDSKLFNSTLGGYIFHRYDAENDVHYIDYLALDESDQYAHTVTQVVKFGENLLNFMQSVKGEDIVTVLTPYGALYDPDDPSYEGGPPENGTWNGNRLDIRSVNSGDNWIENADGVAMWGRIVGWKIWEDVTDPTNLLNKATAWLEQQIWSSVSLELTAVDLAFVNADIEQIQVGDYVRCQSKPHNLNLLLLCTEKETHLTELQNSDIVLGAGLKTITDMQRQQTSEVAATEAGVYDGTVV